MQAWTFKHSLKLNDAVDLLSLHQLQPSIYSALFSSVSGAVNGHRYDLLFAGLEPVSLDVLTSVDVSTTQESDLPFVGGYVVLLPYEYAMEVEPCLTIPTHPALEALVWEASGVIVLDHLLNELTLLAKDESWLNRLKADCQTQLGIFSPTKPLSVINMTEDDDLPFLTGVERCREYILAGDVFQVNLSRQWQAHIDIGTTPSTIYHQLRAANPAPFSALLTWNDKALISSSPERLVAVQNGLASTRPIAGTRRRDQDPDKDNALVQELKSHPKENAEHIMLLDLERNDLGRVCVPGSVKVDELMTIESYAHVHHIVSNVVGKLKPHTTAKQVIDAVFPGGTITGCPKVRCMEIIAELEQIPRGVYTGSLGYVSIDGKMDFNILIRSFFYEPGKLTFRAGAGIVFDSTPQSELEETRHKAKGLMRALVPEKTL